MAATPNEEAFEQYKKVEKEALRMASELMEQSAKVVDIEVAMIAAIFLVHRKRSPNLPPEQVARIIQGHAEQLIPFFKNDTEKN